jgi:hypothetical protein
MSDVEPAAVDWIEQFSAAIGLEPPAQDEITALLALAGAAAHASHRQAAPVACWLAARAGLTPADALEAARRLA